MLLTSHMLFFLPECKQKNKLTSIQKWIISKNATIWDFNVGIIWNYSELFISSQILGNT